MRQEGIAFPGQLECIRLQDCGCPAPSAIRRLHFLAQALRNKRASTTVKKESRLQPPAF